MSGRRQHFLPKFLQRGFTTTPGSERTWLYWQSEEPREVGIRDVGIETDFYSEAGNATVDDAITDIESNEFSAIVGRARESGAGSFYDPGLPRLLAHLEVRSRNLRQGALAVSERVLIGILDRIDQPDVLERILKSRMERNHSSLMGQIRMELRAKGLPQSRANEMFRLMKKAVPSVVQSSRVSEVRAQLRLLLPRVLKEGAKRGQINALERSIAPEVRAEVYEPLHFELKEVICEDMILGDSGVLFLV